MLRVSVLLSKDHLSNGHDFWASEFTKTMLLYPNSANRAELCAVTQILLGRLGRIQKLTSSLCATMRP